AAPHAPECPRIPGTPQPARHNSRVGILRRLVREGGVVALGVAEGLERRQHDAVGRGAVKGTVAAVGERGTGRAEQAHTMTRECVTGHAAWDPTSRSEEHTSELQSRGHLVCRLLLEKKKIQTNESRSISLNHSNHS